MKALMYDSLFQSIVLGPLAGLILGAILEFLRGGSSPKTYMEIRKIIVERHVPAPAAKPASGSSNPNGSGDDGVALLIAVCAVFAVTLWGFMRYFEEITLALLGFTAFMAALTMGMHLTARLRGRPFDAWFVDAAVGTIVSAYCGGIVWWTRAAMDPYLVAAAKSLGPWEFVKSLSQATWHSLPFQMAGLLLLGLLMLFITMRAIHHLSLYSADPESDAGFWWWMAWKTKHTSGLWGLATIALLGGMTWLSAVDSLSPDGLLPNLFTVHLAFR